MSVVSLRRSGGLLIITIPQSYIKQNHLKANDNVEVVISGNELKITPVKRRYTLSELLIQTPKGLCRIDEWDNMSIVGNE